MLDPFRKELSPKVRVKIARQILSLAELADRARPATYVSFADFGAVRAPRAQPESIERNAMRLARWLKKHGVDLVIQRSPTGEPLPVENRFEWRIHVAAPELLDFVEPLVREARRIEEEWDARQEARLPDFGDLEEAVDGAEVVIDYKRAFRSFAKVRRRFGIGYRKARKIIAAGGVEIRPPKLSRIEIRRPAADVRRALELADEGRPVEEIASLLRCAPRTAHRVLRRAGRARPTGRPRSDP